MTFRVQHCTIGIGKHKKGVRMDTQKTSAERDKIIADAVDAIQRMQDESERNGNCNMTLDEINAEIAAVRAERRAREAKKKDR